MLRHSDERLGNRLVLIVLADHASHDGSGAFCSVPTIADEARMSERNVQYALRDLERKGSIRQTGRHRSGTKVYEIPGVQILQGVQNSAKTRSDFAPEPSLTVISLGCKICGVRPRNKSMAEHLIDVHGIFEQEAAS